MLSFRDKLDIAIAKWKADPKLGFQVAAKPYIFKNDLVSKIPVQPPKTFDFNEPMIEIRETAKLRVIPIYHLAGVPGTSSRLFLRESVVKLLLKASELLPSDLVLVVLDAWRSKVAQYEILNVFSKIVDQEASKFAYNPDAVHDSQPVGPPPHLTGGAVDVSLGFYDESNFVDMGGYFDELTERSHSDHLLNTDYEGLLHPRMLLIHIMQAIGFANYPNEWWHFDFGNHFWAHYRQIGGRRLYDEISIT